MNATLAINRQTAMEILRQCFSGKPNTSWETILDNVLWDFENYCTDEISGFIAEQNLDESEILSEFEQFCVFTIHDINEYDVI